MLIYILLQYIPSITFQFIEMKRPISEDHNIQAIEFYYSLL